MNAGRSAAAVTKARLTQVVRGLVREIGALKAGLALAYVLLILFLLAVSVGFDDGSRSWRLGPVEAESIVLALLLFLPVLLPRIAKLTIPFFGGQASIQFQEVHHRIDVQEERVEALSNETDLILTSLAANLLAPGPSRLEARERETLVIGSQRGLEQRLLSALLKTLLQGRLGLGDDEIYVRYGYGGVALNFISLYRGKIDLFPSYTWQGFEMSLGPSLQHSAEALRPLERDAALATLDDFYRDSGLAWLPPLGFSSNWEVVVLRDARKTGSVTELDQLASQSDRLVLGCTREFFARDAAYGALERRGNRFREVRLLEESELYEQLLDEAVDVIVGSSTDTMLDNPAVRRLSYSTRAWFGEYHAAPVARAAVLEKHDSIADAVEALGASIAEGGGRNEIVGLVRRARHLGGSDDVLELAAKAFLEGRALI